MKLFESEGKELFKKYGIPVPESVLLGNESEAIPFEPPFVLKAQVKSGDRKKHGGIAIIDGSHKNPSDSRDSLQEMFLKRVQGEDVKHVLVEQFVKASKEYYVSLSYDAGLRAPVLALSAKGGSGIAKAALLPIDLAVGLQPFIIKSAAVNAKFPSGDLSGIIGIVGKLWDLFIKEHALLAEINPLFKTEEGTFVAGDAKIILDDEKLNPSERRFVEMGGDIAILASGGGASMINIDALLASGGRPANYTEYSGNPPASVVKELTLKVLSRPGLRGVWVVGGIANFTDIYETLRGFIEGVGEVAPKPDYPIVIRRDGPRQKEAFEMLREVREKEGYDIHLYGGETSMAETARIMVKLARAYRPGITKP